MKSIEQLQAEIAKLQQELEETKNKVVKGWPYGEDNTYFVASESGTTYDLKFCEDGFDTGCFSQGNAFRTEAEAEAEVHARATITALRNQFGAKKFAVGGCNYYLFIDIYSTTIDVVYTTCTIGSFGDAYFETEDDALSAIEDVGQENIIKAAKWRSCGIC